LPKTAVSWQSIFQENSLLNSTRPAYLERASEFLFSTRLADIDAPALDRARWIFADCIPVIAAGMQVPEMQALVQSHLAQAAPGTSWVIGTGRRASALDAGLLNGTAGTWLELDEGNLFAMGHPGIQIVPAALAVAQAIGASGADLLRAVTLAYEISSRIARSAVIRWCIHPHGTYGVIGAAVAVGLLKGFTQRQLRELLNVSATMGMATSRNTLLEGSTVRNIYTGHSAYMGQMAATLVQSGFTGESDGVASIFGKVLSDTFDADRVVESLGSEWLIAQNYFKLHCTGRYVHSAIDALEDALLQPTAAGLIRPTVKGLMHPAAEGSAQTAAVARAQPIAEGSTRPGANGVAQTMTEGLDVDAIDRIDIRAYKFAAALSGKTITSSFGARFSIPFAIASILYHGRSGLKSFDDAAVANPVVQALTQRVTVVEDDEFNKTYPQQQRCVITISLKNGKTIVGHCEVTKGESSKPHSPADLKGKFIELGTSVWGDAMTHQLFERLMHIESIPNVGKFADEFSL
jgi:2-methylcitrate dehydratase PrpD